MKQITGQEFEGNIKKDPAWCLSVRVPIEITTYVELGETNITHLSPLLHFKEEADFSYCKNLKEACGVFYKIVNFSKSNIRSTKNLKVLGVDRDGWSVRFYECEHLKVLEGEFEGAVDLEMSSVKKIEATVKNRSTKAIHEFEKNRKFFINGCDKLIPNKKYLSSDYQIDEPFRKTCIRESLSRLPSK